MKEADLKKFSGKIIDLRPQKAFSNGHIPGALHFPLYEWVELDSWDQLSGEERTEFLKKKYGFVVEKLIYMVGSDPFVFYCQKGTKESKLFRNWFRPEFPDGIVLRGGYSSYRKAVKGSWNTKYPLISLAGLTGSGKTEFLQVLKGEGFQVLDLEQISGHKGSAFGQIDGESCVSQEQFENELYHRLGRNSHPVFVEIKGRYLGQLYLPIHLYRQAMDAPRIFLDTPKSKRVERLVEVYCNKNDTYLLNGLENLKSRIEGEVLEGAKMALFKKDYSSFIEMLLDYYDSSQDYSEGKSELGNRLFSGGFEACLSFVRGNFRNEKQEKN